MKKSWEILLVLLVAAVLLTGCKAKAPQEAQEACESFFAAFTSQDEAALAAVLEGGELSMPASQMQQLMEEKLSFSIKESKKDGDTVTISAVITAVDLEQVLLSLPESVNSQETAREALLAALQKENVPRKDFSVEVLLVQQDGKWVVRMTRDLADALLGGYYSILDKLAEEVGA